MKIVNIRRTIKNKRKDIIELLCASLVALGMLSVVDIGCNHSCDVATESIAEDVESNIANKFDNLDDSLYLTVYANLDVGDYYFKDRILYDQYDNVVDLTGELKSLYFNNTNVSKKSFEVMNLKDSKPKALYLSLSSVTDDCISEFPETIKTLSLKKCNFLNDLSDLPKYCPNIQNLYLNGTTLDNLDFIYDLPNLEVLEASETLCITDDILDYLYDNNIETNITREDIALQDYLKKVANSLVTDDMTDKEKLLSICSYVVDNLEYDKSITDESNVAPIRYALENGKGVCLSYSSLLYALLNLSGVENYKLDNVLHAWNLIKLDNQYYYVDLSNVDTMSGLHGMVLRTFKKDKSYMFDPTIFNFDSTTTVDNYLTIISESLRDDVLNNINSNENGNPFNKYLRNPTIIKFDVIKLIIILLYSNEVYYVTKSIAKEYKKLKLEP